MNNNIENIDSFSLASSVKEKRLKMVSEIQEFYKGKSVFITGGKNSVKKTIKFNFNFKN